MSLTVGSLVEMRESSLVSGTNCSKIALGGEKGCRHAEPQAEANLAGALLLSRLELDHGAFQLPGALQMKESSKHDNKRKLGRWIPREGRTGASTEHFRPSRADAHPRQSQLGCSSCFCLPFLDCLSPTWQATVLALHFTN